MNDNGFITSEVRVVEASAGSGKTYALARRYVKLLLSAGAGKVNESPRSILAITFSNKAAVEMKVRILDLLKKIALGAFVDDKEKDELFLYLQIDPFWAKQRASGVIDEVLAHYNFLQVQTIDSFINTILSGCAFRLNISPTFRIKDDFQRYIAYGFDRMVDAVSGGGEEEAVFLRFLKQYIYLDNQKSWLPRKDILSIMSGLFEEVNSHGLPLVKFPKEPADLLAKRRDLFALMLEFRRVIPEGVNRVTWGSFLDKFSEDADIIRLESFFTPFSKDDLRMRKNCVASQEALRLWSEVRGGIAEYYEWAAFSRFNCYIDIFAGVKKYLAQLAAKENVLFLNELNNKLRMLWGQGMLDVPELYYRLATRFRHFLLDEFQDTSVIQWQNLKPMAEEALSNGGTLFMVGDRKQAIYRFRGGDVALMREVPETFAQFNVSIDLLNRNYRSCKEVVEFNNSLFSQANLRNFLTRLSEYGETPEALGVLEIFSNASQDVPQSANGGYVRVQIIESAGKEDFDEESRKRVIAVIRDLKDARMFAYRDIALLCRSNREVGVVTSWLMEEGIPVESEKTLNIRGNILVKEMVAFLAFLNSPIDNLAFSSFLLGEIFSGSSGIANEEIHGFFFDLSARGDKKTAKEVYFYREFQKQYPLVWKRLFEPFFKNVGLMPLYEMAVSIIAKFAVMDNFRTERAFILGLLELIKQSEEECQGDVGLFLEWFANISAERLYLHISGSDSVRVLTIHKAKGLEFPVVIIPALEFRVKVGGRGAEGADSFVFTPESEGATLLYLKRSEGPDFSAELKRRYLWEYFKSVGDELCAAYVACTRAVQELYLMVRSAPASGNAGKKANPAVLLLPAQDLEHGRADVKIAKKPADGVLMEIPPPVYGDWINFLREEFPSLEELRNRKRIADGEFLHALLAEIGISGSGGLSAEAVVDSACSRVCGGLAGLGPELELPRKRALKLIGDPATAWIWDPSLGRVHCEKEFIDLYGRSLRIDRLIVGDLIVKVIDYKSSSSDRQADRRQMEAYLRIISEVYPGKRIEGYIVYLDSCQIERL